MPSFEVQVSDDDKSALCALLDTYRPRLTYSIARKPWWSSGLALVATVSGEDPYLSNARTEAQDWQEEILLRRAW